jgi:signal transduction histidine kinase
MPGQLAAWWRRLPVFGQDLVLGFLVVVAWVTGTVLMQVRSVGGGATLLFPNGQHEIAMWGTAAAVTFRRSVPPVALLLAVPVYVVLLGPPLLTEFHLLPILVVAYSVAQSGRISPLVVAGTCLAGTALLFEIIPPWNNRGALYWIPLLGSGYYDDGLTGFDWSRVLFSLFVVVGTTFLGALVREQRRTTAALAARNEELERLRAVESQKVVVEERTRIARELHDVVAHHVSAIVIRAQAAERLAPTRPEVATEAVSWIADAGKEALTGMRHAVQVLRQADGGSEVELAPQPTLADLRDIVERLAPAGLDVQIELPSPLPIVDPQVELAAVRIAQEGVTNALRHADARRTVVSVTEQSGNLLVAVDDDGRTGAIPTLSTSGHGLQGMAERAAACGGRLDILPSVLGGWSVQATLPMLRQTVRP